MTLEITVGPPKLAINQGHSVLITDPDGQIPWPSDKGLYSFDTRLISSWKIYANGAGKIKRSWRASRSPSRSR